MLDAFRISVPDSLPTSPQSERGAARSYAGSSQAVPDSRSSSPPRPSVLLAPGAVASVLKANAHAPLGRPRSHGGPLRLALSAPVAAAAPATAGGRPTKTPRWIGEAESTFGSQAARPPAAAARPSPVPTFAAPPRAPSTPAKRPGSAGINDTFPADLLDAFKTPALPKKLKRLVTPPADDVAGAPG
jgi:hypothetical protein